MYVYKLGGGTLAHRELACMEKFNDVIHADLFAIIFIMYLQRASRMSHLNVCCVYTRLHPSHMSHEII